MHISLTVSAYVGIRKGCPMTYSLNSDNQIEFSFGGVRDGFDFSFDAEALKELLNPQAERRQTPGDSWLPVEGDVDDSRQITGDKTQMEQM